MDRAGRRRGKENRQKRYRERDFSSSFSSSSSPSPPSSFLFSLFFFFVFRVSLLLEVGSRESGPAVWRPHTCRATGSPGNPVSQPHPLRSRRPSIPRRSPSLFLTSRSAHLRRPRHLRNRGISHNALFFLLFLRERSTIRWHGPFKFSARWNAPRCEGFDSSRGSLRGAQVRDRQRFQIDNPLLPM